jgi:glutathione S-transferase
MVIHLLLLEIGAPHELRPVDLESGAQRDASYLKLNPSGVVPTLLIDGVAYSEAAALALLLGERHPEAQLAPALDSPQRPAYLQWMIYLANTLQPAFRMWFYPTDAPEFDAESLQATARRRIELAWERIEAHLTTSGPYLLGERISIADLYATMLMRWSRNMPRPATSWPALTALAARVKARPAWKRLYEIEGLTEWA